MLGVREVENELDFGFTEEQSMLRKTARQFVDEEIMPISKDGMQKAGLTGHLEEACGSWFYGCLYT